MMAASVDAQSKKDQRESKKLVEQGDKQFKQRNYRNALENYAKAVVLVPNNAHAHFWKGMAHYYLNEFNLALPELSTALNQGYNRPLDIYLVRWRLHYANQDFDLALDDVRKGLAIDGNNLDFLLALGDLSFAAKQFSEALDAYQRVLVRNPTNADLYLNIAKCHFFLGNVDEQAASAEEALKRGTRSPADAHMLIGDAAHRQFRFEDAILSYQRVLSIKSDEYEPYRRLAEAYRALSRFNEAIEISQRAIRTFPNDGGIYTDISWYYSLADRHEEAVAAAQAAISLVPDQYMAYTNLCRAYNDLGRFEVAITACNNALRLKPEDGETLFYLGRANRALGRTAEAAKLFSRSVTGLEKFVSDNPTYSDGYYLLGNAYFADGKQDRALSAYQRCLQLSPNFVKALYNVGIIYLLQENKPLALEQYNRLLKLDRKYADRLKAEIDRI
jgi:superkiller protein 3